MWESANRKSGLRSFRARLLTWAVIYRFDYRRYHLPVREPLRTAHGVWAARDGVLVRMQAEDGRQGFGEAAVLPCFGTETADEVEAACRDLPKYCDEQVIATVPRRLACLRHALTAAVAEFRPERPVADGSKALPVAALLPAGRAVLGKIDPLVEAGFRVFKWKVGVGDIADELGLLDDICARLPEGAKLRLDANGAWTRRQAERWLERVADRPVEFVEQPCFAKAVEGSAVARQTEDLLLGLAADYPTPLALDESLVSGAHVAHWLQLGWPGVYVLKPALCGDAVAAIQRLADAQAKVVFSSALETAIGAKRSLTLAFQWRGELRALGFGVWPLFTDARCDGPVLAPFMRWEDVQRINEEAVWNAVT